MSATKKDRQPESGGQTHTRPGDNGKQRKKEIRRETYFLFQSSAPPPKWLLDKWAEDEIRSAQLANETRILEAKREETKNKVLWKLTGQFYDEDEEREKRKKTKKKKGDGVENEPFKEEKEGERWKESRRKGTREGRGRGMKENTLMKGKEEIEIEEMKIMKPTREEARKMEEEKEEEKERETMNGLWWIGGGNREVEETH